MKRFENKVVWITGASSGIGEATAYAFANEGAKLILSARREEELLRVKKATGLPDADVFVLPIDVEKSEEIEPKAQQAIQHFGRIDVLFNNAGISQRSSVEETEMAIYQKIMNLNFFWCSCSYESSFADDEKTKKWTYCSNKQFIRKTRYSDAFGLLCFKARLAWFF